MEEIVYCYPSLKLADVYVTIAFYLNRQQEVAAYLQQWQQRSQEIRGMNEAKFDLHGFATGYMPAKHSNLPVKAMSHDAIELYEPINTLKSVDEDIWIVDGPIVRMAMYGTSIPFPTRMTIVRLSSRELWCHSPIELTWELKAQIDALGSVRHLISPNKIHYAHIGTWAKAYPEAIAWASPGVGDRAAQQKIEVTFRADLEDEPPPQWAADLNQLIFRGSRFMDEVVFFHHKSATLILADLIENFELDKIAKKFHWLLRLAGSADPDGKAPLDLRMTFWGQKDQARSRLKRMLQWQPKKIILSHGRWYKNDGTAELRRAFRWLG